MTDQNAKRTVIGPDTVVNGEIQSKQDLVIQGRVEGTLSVDAVLFIEVGGVVDGDVTATHVVIAGTLKGTLEVEDALEVAETGRVMGQVTAPRMLVADGALMNAELRMSGAPLPATETAAEVTEAVATPRDTQATRRSVYSYTLPATQQAAPDAVEDDDADVEEPGDVVEVAATPGEQAKKGGKKKKS
jgi:cytoskeletal protein CcmA (bactofilin family)